MYKILANTLFLGKQIIYLPTCHSTNDVAADLVSNSATMEGAFVIADDQTKGRGQRGNTWHSAKGKNIMCSIILKPTFLIPEKQFYLNMISSLAIKKAISGLLPNESVMVKWPNDVLVNKRKVAGILIENSLSSKGLTSSVFGLGINVNEKEFDGLPATSISTFKGGNLSLQMVLERVFTELEQLYISLKRGNLEAIKESYMDSLYGYGVNIPLSAEYNFTGKIVDVKDSGLLLVQEGNTLHEFDFKEVSFLL